MSGFQEFWVQLERGPAVLFLGQGYLQLETGSDPLLVEVQSRFGNPSGTHGYNILLEGTASDAGESAIAWMWERSRRISPPQALKYIAEYPWSSIFSSAIDPIWLPAFRNSWREVASISDDAYFPRDPRNRRVLNCTYLFGSLSETEPKLRPPLSRFEFLNRKQMARNLAQRLADVMTPLGTLAIEGYRVDDDWFPLDDFFPILQALGSGQVHLFNVDDDLLIHPLISELVRTNRLVTHRQSLARTLSQGDDQGHIKLGKPNGDYESGRRVSLRDVSIPIPRELWNRVSNSAALLDTQVLHNPQSISDDALYWEFRRFLFECGTRPLWSGFARGFAFQREYEEGLRKTVRTRLGRLSSPDQPVVIHGQTGTGKTVALGSLAYSVAKSGDYPVIFIERKTQRPTYPDIDECCRWMEDRGAKATLIVWDGMIQPSEYHELQGYLASRGRNAVVVGSSYKLTESGSHLIPVPDQLSAPEAKQFAEFLEEKQIELSSHHRHALEKREPSYLVALYRYLTPARPQITTGVVQELEQLEQELVASINQLEVAQSQFGTLASALFEAGIIDRSQLEQSGISQDSEVRASDVAELVDIVTVPGRFGISIPIELLARTWEKQNFSDVAHYLRGFDLIQTYEDTAGRVVVGPRHSLEAKLIVQARLGSVQSEAAIVGRIVRAMRPWSWGADESDELGFIIELLRAVGPQGDEQNRFAPFFRELAEAIAEVRESRTLRSPRLMLQEANFFREWVTSKSRQGQRPEDAGRILDRARSTLQDALEMLDDNRQWRLRTYIATELASTFGAATIYAINSGANVESVKEQFKQVLQAVRTARTIDFSTYNPVDVLVWSTSAFTSHQEVDDLARTEAIVDALDALETVDPDLLDSVNLDKFHRRRYEVGKLLGSEELSESAFQSLVALGSATGYYIRALEIVGPPSDSGVQPRDWTKYKDAWAYLEQHRGQTANDPRCLNLLFNYWWISKTGNGPFSGERELLRFTHHDWSYVQQLIKDLKSLENSRRGPILSFLEAIALFHLDHVPAAIQLFKEVENESFMVSSRRRVSRSYIASEEDGRPRTFHGTVRSIEPGGRRGYVFVDELRQHITFIPQDFGRPDIRQGDSLGEFHIAFNFIGPIADPPGRAMS